MIANLGALNKKVDVMAGAVGKYRDLDTVEDGIIHKGVWAAVQPLRGKEYLEAQRTATEAVVKITVRYRSTVTEGCKIIYRDHVYDVQSVVDVDMAHEVLELYCVEKQRGAAKRRAVASNV